MMHFVVYVQHQGGDCDAKAYEPQREELLSNCLKRPLQLVIFVHESETRAFVREYRTLILIYLITNP